MLGKCERVMKHAHLQAKVHAQYTLAVAFNL